MEAWQVFDASTAELLAQLDLLGSPSSDASRLAALIHQELVERGHLRHFLGNLGVLQDETAPKPPLLLQQVPETLTQQAKEWQTSSDELQIGLAADDIGPQQEHNYQAQLDLSTATATSAYHSKAADTETCEAEPSWHLVANINNSDAGDSCTAPQASSVLDAAVAAYKQEKRRLWKAKKAGAQAGWGFTKPHPSWPKPDKRAAAALGPLRSSSKVVAQGGTSLMQRTASCNAPSATPSATQTVQEVQQVEVPPSTTEETTSGISPPLSGHILFAAHQVALPKLAPEVVMPDKHKQQQQQQPSYAPCECDLATLSWQTAEASCTSANGSVQGKSDSLQQLQHSEAGACQEHGSGSIPDAESPQIASAEAGQNYTSAELLHQLPAATLQHNKVVHLSQQSALLTNQMYLDAHLNGSENVPGTPSQSSSEVDARSSVQQYADSCAIGCEHTEEPQYVGSTSGLSSSDSECSSSAEQETIAADCDKQAGCQPAGFNDISTSSWVNRPSCSDHVSEACSESSEADMTSAGEVTWQEAAVAPVAPHQQQPHTAHRLNEWNMPGNEGLCSWPTTPLHDPFNVAASPHMSQGQSRTHCTHLAGMCQSLATSKTDQADRLITFATGERLVLG